MLLAENERNRIGRDLHDTLGHVFAAMTLKTELALKQLERKIRPCQKQLEELNHSRSSCMTLEILSIILNLEL